MGSHCLLTTAGVWPLGGPGRGSEEEEHEERVIILPDPSLKGLHGWLCRSMEVHTLLHGSSLYSSLLALIIPAFPALSGCGKLNNSP